MISDGSEEITQIRRKKKLDFGRGEEDKQLVEDEHVIPTEVIKTKDDFLIKNYEVDFQDEDPDVKMSGGLRGIQALRVQRDYIQDVDTEQGKNPFHRYEGVPSSRVSQAVK